MRTIRNAFGAVICLLMTAGYAASQWAYFNGQWAEYAQRVDVPSVRLLALALLAACVVLAMIPNRESTEGQDPS